MLPSLRQPEYVNRDLVMYQLHLRLSVAGVLGDVLNVCPEASVQVPAVLMLQEANPSPLNWLVPPLQAVEAIDVVWEDLVRGLTPDLRWLGLGRERGATSDETRWFGDGRSPRPLGATLLRLVLLAARARGELPTLTPSSFRCGPYAFRSDAIQSVVTGRWHAADIGRLPSRLDLGLQGSVSFDRLPCALKASGVESADIWALTRAAIEGFDDAFEALEQEAFTPRSRLSWRVNMPVIVTSAAREMQELIPDVGESEDVESLLEYDLVDMAALYRAAVPRLCTAKTFQRHIAPNPTSSKPRKVRPETRAVWARLLLTGELSN